jgi:predicted Zn-dependent peptidase
MKKQGAINRKHMSVWRRNAANWVLLAVMCLALLAQSSLLAVAQSNAGGNESSAQKATTQLATQLQQNQALQSIVAKQAALVTEFDVNGLKVLVKRREGSLTVAAGLFIRGGSRNITAENAGIEALMLDVSSEASANFPRERMRSELARMGTGIRYGINADYSVLSFACTRPNFERSWKIFVDVVLRPSFAKEDVALIQGRLVTSRRDDNDDPDSYLQRLQDRVAYAGHPYLNRSEGTAESLSRLTSDDLRAYHQKIMETSRLLLVIVGDLNPAQVRQLVASSFGKLPRGNYRPEPIPQLSFDRSTVVVTPRTLPTNYIQGLYTAPPPNSPDMDAMRIASSILRDRIFEEVRAKRNLSYAPDAFLRSQAANIGGIYVTAVDANQAVGVMLDEITRLQREPISAQEIQAVVAQFLTSYYLGQETNAAQAGDLALYELLGGGWRNSVEVIERLKAVTPADVQRVSQKYMRNIRFVVLGNPQSVNADVFTGHSGG